MPHPLNRSPYHGFRYHQEQAELEAGAHHATPAQKAIWNLDDRLKAIATAENALASDLTPGFARRVHIRTLSGLSPDDARAAAYRDFRLAYGAAVDAERAAA